MTMEKLIAQLCDRRERLWHLAMQFTTLRDAHVVHDMMVEINGIETVLKELQK